MDYFESLLIRTAIDLGADPPVPSNYLFEAYDDVPDDFDDPDVEDAVCDQFCDSCLAVILSRHPDLMSADGDYHAGRRDRDAESDNLRWCGRCWRRLECYPTACCAEEELQYWDARRGRISAADLVDLDTIKDAVSEDDLPRFRAIERRALSEVVQPAGETVKQRLTAAADELANMFGAALGGLRRIVPSFDADVESCAHCWCGHRQLVSRDGHKCSRCGEYVREGQRAFLPALLITRNADVPVTIGLASRFESRERIASYMDTHGISPPITVGELWKHAEHESCNTARSVIRNIIEAAIESQ